MASTDYLKTCPSFRKTLTVQQSRISNRMLKFYVFADDTVFFVFLRLSNKK
jgi:hypothetical protein